MKYSVRLLLPLVLILSGCQCGPRTGDSGAAPEPAPAQQAAAARADSIAALAVTAPDTAALDAALDQMFAEDDAQLDEYAQAEGRFAGNDRE
ncbi:MAG TPA: hypothetical protein PKM88_04220 [bacterium]|nr:hypothetical protein [bacterium]